MESEHRQQEITFRIADIRLTLQHYIEEEVPVTNRERRKSVRQNLKNLREWLLVGKALCEFKVVTEEFINLMMKLVAQILCARDETQYSGVSVIQYSNAGNLGWVRALLEQGKIGNKDLLQNIKIIALEILAIINHIRESLQIIAFLRIFKSEYSAGYTPHESTISILDIKEKISPIFREFNFNSPQKREKKSYKDPRIAHYMFNLTMQNPISGPSKRKYDYMPSEEIPLEIILLNLIFQEKRGFTLINEKAMESMILKFSQQEKLLKDMLAVDIVVTEEEAKTYKDLLKKKGKAKILIENILNQNTIFSKTEKIAQKKKTISDMQELLSQIIQLMQSDMSELVKRTQNFLRHLKFYIDLMKVFNISGIDPGLINPLLKVIVKFLYMFCLKNSENQALLVPYATELLELQTHGIKVSRLIHQIFLCKKNQKQEKWLIDYLLQKIQEENVSNPDILRLLSSLTESSLGRHSKYILKSILSKKIHKLIMMNEEGSKKKHQLLAKCSRYPKCSEAKTLKNHIYFLLTIANCAEQSEYGRVQGQKLIPEEDLARNLMDPNSAFILKKVYLRMYYSLYIHIHRKEERTKIPPKELTNIIEVVLQDLEKHEKYQEALMKRKKVTIEIEHSEEEKEEESFQEEEEEKSIVMLNLKNEENREVIHDPDEYWTYLCPPNKIEASKCGILNFLANSFKRQKWGFSKELSRTMVLVRQELVKVYDKLYSFQEDRKIELDIGDIAFMICQTIENLPTLQEINDKKKPAKEQLGDEINSEKSGTNIVELHNDSLKEMSEEKKESELDISETHRQLRENSDSANRGEEKKLGVEDVSSLSSILDDNSGRIEDNYNFVISEISSYIEEKGLTIREAFKLFDANSDQKVDRLELRRSIKEICKTAVSYQVIDDAIHFIEKNKGCGEEINALAFAEFSAAIKKELKRRKYQNYKEKPDEVSDVRLEDSEFEYAIKINIALKHFVLDFKRCLEFAPDQVEIEEIAAKIYSIIHFLWKKNKLADISMFLTHLTQAFQRSEYKAYFLKIFTAIIQFQEEAGDPDKVRKRLLNIVSIFVKENIILRVIDILAEGSTMQASEKACTFITYLFEIYFSYGENEKCNEMQQSILNYLKNSKQFQGMFRQISKALEKCSEQLKARSPGKVINLYDKSLFLINMDLGQVIEKIDQIDYFSFVNKLLHLIYLLASNVYTPFQNFLRNQILSDKLVNTASINLLGSVGYLLINAIELDEDLYSNPSYYKLIPYIFDALTQACVGSCVENEVFLGTWVKFIRCLNFFISKRINWRTESEDDLMQQEGFFRSVILLNAILSEKSAEKVSETLLNELDIWALRWKIADIFKAKLKYQQRNYIDDLTCTHSGPENRTCTEYICAQGFFTQNDKRIIQAALDIFIFLSKLKSLQPNHISIVDFCKKLGQSAKKNEKLEAGAQSKFDTEEDQILPSENIERNSQSNCFCRVFSCIKDFIFCNKKPSQVEAEPENTTSKKAIKEVIAISMLEGFLANKRKISERRKSQASKRVLAKYNRQEQLIREQRKTEIIEAEHYYSNYVRNVEINYNGKLQKIYFPVPAYCRYMTLKMEYDVVLDAITDTQQTQLQNLSVAAPVYKVKLEHQQKLSHFFPALLWWANSLRLFTNCSLSFIFLLNILLLLLYSRNDGEPDYLNSSSETTIFAIGMIQVFCSLCLLFSFFLLKFPFLFYRDKSQQNEQLPLYKKVHKKFWEIKIECWLVLLIIVLQFCLSIVALIHNMVYPFLMIFIIPHWGILLSVVKTLYESKMMILQMLVLLVVVIFIYSLIDFKYLDDPFNFESSGESNSNFWKCFTTILNRGLRSFGGVGDILHENLLSNESEEYWSRYFFDLSFFFIINVLLLLIE